jgi:hypothetical protein
MHTMRTLSLTAAPASLHGYGNARWLCHQRGYRLGVPVSSLLRLRAPAAFPPQRVWRAGCSIEVLGGHLALCAATVGGNLVTGDIGHFSGQKYRKTGTKNCQLAINTRERAAGF